MTWTFLSRISTTRLNVMKGAAQHVRYRDDATTDPPNRTLADLPSNGVIVWAVIYGPAESGQKALSLDLAGARHLECCDGPVTVAGGMYELRGFGPSRTYSVIVRIYFGSRPKRPYALKPNARSTSFDCRSRFDGQVTLQHAGQPSAVSPTRVCRGTSEGPCG